MLSELNLERARAIRAAMDAAGAVVAADPNQAILAREIFRVWRPGSYAVGDVRRHGLGLYKCVQAHSSVGNPAWSPDAVPALWAPYHGTTAATALPWAPPTGAQDMYLAGEYMVYTDGRTYCCKQDTAYSPDDYAAAWEVIA